MLAEFSILVSITVYVFVNISSELWPTSIKFHLKFFEITLACVSRRMKH